MQKIRLIIVGNSDPVHVGNHFRMAAEALFVPYYFCDVKGEYKEFFPIKKFNWLFRGGRPTHLNSFSDSVVERCSSLSCSEILIIGIAPLSKEALVRIGELGVRRINYLTDDPFSKTHSFPWFKSSLTHYDVIFSPRRSNIQDLTNFGCKEVEYLPFAYNPGLFYPESLNREEREKLSSDIIFFGGADTDRLPYLEALIKSGMKVALYGGYWSRYKQTRKHALGIADISTLRKAVSCAKIALCLVRKANRDGHSMRTFEIPAIGCCMLTEDTLEHRQLFGEEGKAVVYFKTYEEILEKARWLLEHDDERSRLASSVSQIIKQGNHTYEDRLKVILKLRPL